MDQGESTTVVRTIREALTLNLTGEVDRITTSIRETVLHRFKKRGAVIGISGGIDSTVVAFLCARALGKERVILLSMPEVDSSPDCVRLGRLVASQLEVRWFLEDISPILHASRCYERRDQAIQGMIPDFGKGYKTKIILPTASDPQRYALFYLVAQSPTGDMHRERLTLDAYLGIVASTNFKQRTRKMMEYYYADLFNCAVAGTPNRLEYDQGFFVKNGDGAADFKPIAHLFKTQVYQLAEFLGVPEEIRNRTPTTDTYSLEQTQEEFYFSIPLQDMDICIYAYDHSIAAAELASGLGVTPDTVENVYQNIERKRQFAQYLHAVPVLVESV